ncbi:MAG: amidohydrolase [Actinomycetota bacterium]|nr:amidohydrolase [Actinomycetota bacterium]
MTPRTLLRRGVVHTPTHPYASAIATADGVVTWIGDESGADSMAAAADEVVDLRGALVTPAFVDSHVHLAQTGLAAGALSLHDVRDRDEALQALTEHAARRRDAVLLGFGWDEAGWPDPVPPTRLELDRSSGGRPVYLARTDMHSAIVSSALVERFPAIAAAPGWYPSGRVERHAHHEARGAADALVSAGMREDAIRHALHAAARHGVGLVHEMGAPHLSQVEDFASLDRIASSQALPDVARYWGELGGHDVARQVGALGLAGDLCVDGAIGSRTCALEHPYADAPAARGHVYLEAAQLRDHLVGCTRAGLQGGFHVIGDRALRLVVEALRAAAAEVGTPALRAARHRLEHVEMPDAAALSVLGDLGVVASVQPAFDAAWGGTGGVYALRLGVERALAMNPFASMRAAGVVLALGSDSPVTPVDGWGGVRAASTHRTAGQSLSAQQAFDAHTRGGWWAIGRDDGGVLRPGSAATYAVWDVHGDLVGRLPDLSAGRPLPTCRTTVVRGRVIHDERWDTAARQDDSQPTGLAAGRLAPDC